MKKIISVLIALAMLACFTPAVLAASLGDVDADGHVTAGDARLALRAAVGLEPLTADEKARADADADGFVTAADARLILRVAVDLSEISSDGKRIVDKPASSGGSVMTHAEYEAAQLDTQVCVETYVQAKQSWWENKVCVYAQSPDGAYFIYNMACSEKEYQQLIAGKKIRVTGYKSEWCGEIEITDATFEILQGSYIASPYDVTALLGTDRLLMHQNEYVSFRQIKVEASYNASGDAVPFLYSYDGSGSVGSDLYFNGSVNGKTYVFTVESYLTDESTEVYRAVQQLRIGDVIDMEGFLYWYNGSNPHITRVSPAVMTHAEYEAAQLDTQVCVETYVQAKQSWWENKVCVYAQSPDGAYFIYNMACSEKEYQQLIAGKKIRVTGYKSEWCGEIEITDATFEILQGSYIASPYDVTALLGTDRLLMHQNEYVSFRRIKVEASYNANGKAVPFLYSYDGSGSVGSDLYFNGSVNGKTYVFTVESYLTDESTDVYRAVQQLCIGDVIDMEGFLYWYVGPCPHITAVSVK